MNMNNTAFKSLVEIESRIRKANREIGALHREVVDCLNRLDRVIDAHGGQDRVEELYKAALQVIDDSIERDNNRKLNS